VHQAVDAAQSISPCKVRVVTWDAVVRVFAEDLLRVALSRMAVDLEKLDRADSVFLS
jgi:hypothetical protein